MGCSKHMFFYDLTAGNGDQNRIAEEDKKKAAASIDCHTLCRTLILINKKNKTTLMLYWFRPFHGEKNNIVYSCYNRKTAIPHVPRTAIRYHLENKQTEGIKCWPVLAHITIDNIMTGLHESAQNKQILPQTVSTMVVVVNYSTGNQLYILSFIT